MKNTISTRWGHGDMKFVEDYAVSFAQNNATAAAQAGAKQAGKTVIAK
jgi:hypothetical protein